MTIPSDAAAGAPLDTAPTVPSGELETDVLIIGSGPAGGAAALALATLGVEHMVLTKYRWTANTPRAHITNQRAMDKVKAGQLPGPEMSIAKLSLTNNMTRVANLLSLALGPKLIADSGEWGTYAWSELVLGIPGMRVAGGTDEVMRNIVGERVLGLPKEPPGPTGR